MPAANYANLSHAFHHTTPSAAIEKRIQDRLRAGMGITKIAREVGVGNGTVQRIADQMHRPFVAS